MTGATQTAPRNNMQAAILIKLAEYPKALRAVATIWSGVFSFGITEAITGRDLIAAFIGILSAGVTGWIATRPAVLSVKLDEQKQHFTEQTSNDQERDRLHARELAFESSRTTYFMKLEKLSRISKHKAINELNAAYLYIRDLQRSIDRSGTQLEYDAFNFKTYDQICGDEDRQMAELDPPASISVSSETKITK